MKDQDNVIGSNRIFQFIFFGCSVFILAGASNNGASGVFCAIPFAFCLIILTVSDLKVFHKAFVFVSALGCVLLVLRINESQVYYTGIGKVIKNTKPICLEYRKEWKNYDLTKLSKCENEKVSNDVEKKNVLIPEGQEFTITEVKVHHGDFTEYYSYQAQNDNISFSDSDYDDNFVLKSDGSKFNVNDVRNPVLYYLSCYMYWPLLFGGVFSIPFFFLIPFGLYCLVIQEGRKAAKRKLKRGMK